MIKQLSTNNNLSLVFLCGKSFIEKPGIYSFHLHGTMMPSVRDFNTGFICFDNSNKDKFIDNFEILLHYLLINNPLYKDIEELNKEKEIKWELQIFHSVFMPYLTPIKEDEK